MYIYIYIYIYINRTSCAQVHELPQSHCGDNREGTLFSRLHIYIYIYIYIHILLPASSSTTCVIVWQFGSLYRLGYHFIISLVTGKNKYEFNVSIFSNVIRLELSPNR